MTSNSPCQVCKCLYIGPVMKRYQAHWEDPKLDMSVVFPGIAMRRSDSESWLLGAVTTDLSLEVLCFHLFLVAILLVPSYLTAFP